MLLHEYLPLYDLHCTFLYVIAPWEGFVEDSKKGIGHGHSRVTEWSAERCPRLGLADLACFKRRRKGATSIRKPLTVGLRWSVEDTSSAPSNPGQPDGTIVPPSPSP
jgi:hypothetical protein